MTALIASTVVAVALMSGAAAGFVDITQFLTRAFDAFH